MQIFIVVENFRYGVWNYFYIEAMAGDRSFTLVICDHCSFLFHTENWREEAQGEDEQHIHETRKKNLSRENGVLNGAPSSQNRREQSTVSPAKPTEMRNMRIC